MPIGPRAAIGHNAEAMRHARAARDRIYAVYRRPRAGIALAV